MAYSNIYKQVMREYEKDRTSAQYLYEKRLAEIYEKIPLIKEIDNKISKAGIDLTKAILNKNSNKKEIVSELQSIHKMLIEEKNTILKEYGYKADYLTDIYKCAICKDTGYVGTKKCECFAKRLTEVSYKVSNINEIIKKENFDTFDFRYYSENIDAKYNMSPKKNIEIIWKRCLDYIKNFDNKLSNLLLFGNAGLGKTFLCNCIAKDLLDKGKSVLYVTAIELFKMIERERFEKAETDNESEFLKLIYSVDLLIIDDLGTEFQTILSSSELFNIINTRFINGKSVVISTNLSPKNLTEKYSDRVVSRLYGNYDFLEFFGDDIRILKLSKGQPI